MKELNKLRCWKATNKKAFQNLWPRIDSN